MTDRTGSIRACAFIGPTISAEQAVALAPVAVCPPAAVGDVYRAVEAGFTTILVVDGVFHSVPSLQHKEILYALDQECRVYGASSMGALRAAEMSPFGMIGIGQIFQAFNEGRYEDDDEVAVAHAAAEHGFRPLSTPMVTVRHTLAAALERGAVTDSTAQKLTSVAKDLYYPDRHWATILQLGRAADVDPADLDAVLTLLRTEQLDPKRDDAVEALRTVSVELAGPRTDAGFGRAGFEPTYNWEVTIRDESSKT